MQTLHSRLEAGLELSDRADRESLASREAWSASGSPYVAKFVSMAQPTISGHQMCLVTRSDICRKTLNLLVAQSRRIFRGSLMMQGQKILLRPLAQPVFM